MPIRGQYDGEGADEQFVPGGMVGTGETRVHTPEGMAEQNRRAGNIYRMRCFLHECHMSATIRWYWVAATAILVTGEIQEALFIA